MFLSKPAPLFTLWRTLLGGLKLQITDVNQYLASWRCIRFKSLNDKKCVFGNRQGGLQPNVICIALNPSYQTPKI